MVGLYLHSTIRLYGLYVINLDRNIFADTHKITAKRNGQCFILRIITEAQLIAVFSCYRTSNEDVISRVN
jgi:hypothetical protein